MASLVNKEARDLQSGLDKVDGHQEDAEDGRGGRGAPCLHPPLKNRNRLLKREC